MVCDNVECVPLNFSECCVEVDGEIVGVEIPDRRLIILSVYRSPWGDLGTFLRVLEQVLSRIRMDGVSLILAGDFNLHFQNTNAARVEVLCSFLSEYGLASNFCGATRFSNCLDNVFTNIGGPPCSWTVDLSFSDHKGVVTSFSIVRKKTPITIVKEVRPITERGLNVFYQLVRDADLADSTRALSDADDAAQHFVGILSRLAHKAFPMRRIKSSSSKSLNICWFTPQLRNMRENVRRLNNLYHLTRDTLVSSNLRCLRREYKAAIVSAKRSASDRYVRDHHKSPSALWRVIRSSTAGTAPTHSSRVLTANEFSDFFLGYCNGPRLVGGASDLLSL